MSTLPPIPQIVPATPPPHGPFASLRRMLPPAEVIRFLMVGVFNTVFSLVLYSGFVLLYSHLFPHRGKPLIADFASISSKPIAITVAFLCYKHFVFHTHGNYLKEWLRCFAVYGAGMIPELIALPILTRFFLAFALTHRPAPYLAGAVITVFTATLSYFGHKKFSFRR